MNCKTCYGAITNGGKKFLFTVIYFLENTPSMQSHLLASVWMNWIPLENHLQLKVNNFEKKIKLHILKITSLMHL